MSEQIKQRWLFFVLGALMLAVAFVAVSCLERGDGGYPAPAATVDPYPGPGAALREEPGDCWELFKNSTRVYVDGCEEPDARATSDGDGDATSIDAGYHANCCNFCNCYDYGDGDGIANAGYHANSNARAGGA